MDERFAGLAPDAARLAPSPVYLDGADAIRMTLFGNVGGVTVGLAARVLRPDNTINITNTSLVPTSNRVATSQVTRVSDGWLLGLEVRITGGTPGGNTVWASIDLVRDNGVTPLGVQALCADFVSVGNPIVWPGGACVDPLDGAGCLRSISGTTPGAGAEIVEAVPTNARWELISTYAQFVTSVVAGNRVIHVVIDDGANIVFRGANGQGLAPGNTWQISCGAGITRPINDISSAQFNSLPAGLRMGPGYRWRTITDAKDAGDQYSLVQYLVREWFDV